MSRSPAFLWYSKDWLEGTAEMNLDEKGAYADLLSYQHLKGRLPNDIRKLAKLARCSVEEFKPIWEEIKSKFKEEDGYLYNEKLENVLNDFMEKSRRNKLIGTWAYVLRKLDVSKKDKQKLQRLFNVNDFLESDTEWTTERLSEWCMKNLNAPQETSSYSEDVHKIYEYALGYFPEKYRPDTESLKEGWLDTIDKLLRKDGKDKKEICRVIRWAREDSFWSKNFRSIKKLRQKDSQDTKYYDVFVERMSSDKSFNEPQREDPSRRKL